MQSGHDLTMDKARQTAQGAEDATRRLPRDVREKAIIEGAIRFFAENGFEAATRALAKELGITQPLLYRYFPSKDVLIERVYNEVFVSRWNPEWEALIVDRSRPLEDRLITFYRAYSKAVYDYVWVRIFVYSGLKKMDLNTRYLTIIRERVLIPICKELRHERGLPDTNHLPLREDEVEMVWGLHGAFFYRAIRRYVYSLPERVPDDEAIANDIRQFLHGAPPTQKKIVKDRSKDHS